MSAGAVVSARLNGNTGAANRIYPQILPEAPTYPAVTYQQISAVRTHAMGKDGPIIRVRVQVNSWGKTYAEARTLAGQVEGRLSRFRGLVGSIEVHDVFLDNELETYDSDAQVRRIIQDFTIHISK
jgi:hypothetical protein